MKTQLLLFLIVAIFAISAVSAVSAVGNNSIVGEQIEMRAAHIESMAFEKQLEMNASINYTQGIGVNASKLISIRNQFENISKSVKNMTSHADVDRAVEKLNSLLSDFKSELDDIIAEKNGKTLDLAKNVQDELSKNTNELKTLENNYLKIRQENIPSIFAQRIENLETTLNNLDDQDVDITEAEKRLEDIKLIQALINQALTSDDDVLLNQSLQRALSLSEEIQSTLVDEQYKITENTRLISSAELADRMIVRIKAVNSELKELGVNVTSLREMASVADENLSYAEKAIKRENSSEAKKALAALKAEVKDITDSYDKLIPRFFWSRSIVPADMEDKLKETIVLLNKAADSL